MITIEINGRQLKAEEGQTILDIARDAGIYIPTLCYHEGINAIGACRMCMVEIVKDGRSKMVASCLYPVENGIKVMTESNRAIESRKMIIELLLALCPNSKVIQDMAHKLGVEKSSFASKDDKNECILCGLCVRACSETVGVNAISLVNRGINREVSTPFHDLAQTCIGCGSCHYVCPTGAVKMEDVDGVRRLPNWKAEFKLVKCKKCGNYFATDAQIEYIKKILGTDEAIELCSSCRGI